MTPPIETLNPTERAQLIAARADHWARTRRITAWLLLVWLCATFGTIFFARELSTLTMFGWPLSFYLAAQGVALVNLAIIGTYALAMARVDRRFARRLAGEHP